LKRDYEKTFQERQSSNHRDLAQTKTDEYFADRNDLFYMRIGFDELDNKVLSKYWMKFPAFLRNMPDACVVKGNHFYFIEVKGCRDILRLKLEDMESYDKWNRIAPLIIFTYSSMARELKKIRYQALKIITIDCDRDRYHDNNKEYYKIPWEYIERMK
tara:strand:+ start:796 stop:1269 length:474 start_codon:yes stop_codon:yes gene_type:complete